MLGKTLKHSLWYAQQAEQALSFSLSHIHLSSVPFSQRPQEHQKLNKLSLLLVAKRENTWEHEKGTVGCLNTRVVEEKDLGSN